MDSILNTERFTKEQNDEIDLRFAVIKAAINLSFYFLDLQLQKELDE